MKAPVLFVALAAAVLIPAQELRATPRSDMYTSVGLIGVTITNLGYVGNGFISPFQPSGEWPLNSNVEHLFLGGIWVGAVKSDGSIHVSTGAQDAANLVAGDEIREFVDDSTTPVRIISNRQNDDNYDPAAVANQQIEVAFHDYAHIESGNHEPLGIRVVLRALAWANPFADDSVILDYYVINVSGAELRDVYVGFWNDTSVGNTEETNPYDAQAATRWDWYDDANGGWGPAEWVDPQYAPDGDPNIWMMYEYDPDGDEGVATSWFGCRLLGSKPAPEPAENMPPVSYNAWQFRDLPDEDDTYSIEDEPDVLLPGKYQLMGNGRFTVGETQETDYTTASDWVGMISTGPFPYLGAGDTLNVTFALVAGADSLALLENSLVAQVAYDSGFAIASPPPSPRFEPSYQDNSVILRWSPGTATSPEGYPLATDDPARLPEHHINTISAREDFEGYRVYRYQGEVISEDPYQLATMVAQYDIVNGKGFDTGLPPLNADGLREWRDDNLLQGFPYWYSLVSYSEPDPGAGLEADQSGFNENAVLLYPGPAAADGDNPRGIGVYPNPYRAASMLDARTGGERELNRKVWFTGLPARCRIQVFNLAGHIVKTIEHDDAIDGKHAWDLLSDDSRAIGSGLYIFAVEDLATGGVQRGKLVIIK